ncbi:MAG: hypothetical protein JWN76_332, partial [Chitinophagaceae bacterium]|nr:hypothetical protein [Chitinophagaceae bacterium]
PKMKSVFDTTIREDLINRINALNENSTPQWGKMNIYQMLKHCTLCEEMYLGKRKYKRALIGRLFGKMGLRNLLKDETPIKPNSPTSPEFKIKEKNGDVPAEKAKWISLIEEYAQFSNDNFEHWFFGKMTKEQIGHFVYKHADHHLRQFNS